MKHPGFFIIGGPKCGTTALAQYLSEHPSVFMAEKEPHYFSTDLENRIYKDWSEYLALFSAANSSHAAVGEASVGYLYSNEAVPNILARYPDARFIVMLRNPVTMAVSLHGQKCFEGEENEPDFERAWELQEARARGRDIPLTCHGPAMLQYRAVCSLGRQYERLLSRVDRERVLPVILDDFSSDPRSVWIEVLHFLGVKDDGRTEFPVVNEARTRKSVLLRRIHDVYLQFRRRSGIPGLGTGMFHRLDRWNEKIRRKKPLSDAMRRKLAREFSDDVRLLSDLLDRDLGDWTNV